MNLPLFPELKPASMARPVEHVARAMALLWTFQPARIVAQVVRFLEMRRPDGREYSINEIIQATDALDAHGSLVRLRERDGYYRLRNELRASLYRQLLESHDPLTVRRALFAALGYQPQGRRHFYWPVRDQGSTIAIVRAALYTGLPDAELDALRQDVSASMDWNAIVLEAALAAFDGPSFERIAPRWRFDLADWAVSLVNRAWNTRVLPIVDWLLERVADGVEIPRQLELGLAEILVHRGESERARRFLQSRADGAASALRACLLVQACDWTGAQMAFEAALKQMQTEVKARRRLLPESVSWYYPIALLAQRTPQHLRTALKFCLGEAGERDPSPYAGWGMWVHALKVRLGDASLQREPFERFADHPGFAGWPGFWCLLLAAWLGPEAFASARRDGGTPFEKIGEKLCERLGACGFEWLAGQAADGLAVMQGKETSKTFFAGERSDRWRELLAALQALGAEPAESDASVSRSRIVWRIKLGAGGAIEAIDPLEQKRGVRGWNRPKPIALSKLAASERLAPWDARVARAIRRDKWNPRSSALDPTQAILALVGHPAVTLAHRPEQLIDLVEGTPTLEVVNAGDRVELRIDPPLRPEADRIEDAWVSAHDERNAHALRVITVVEDTPQRARVIRFTPAQRRAAQLVSRKLAIPASARGELQQVLHALAGHFEIHTDDMEAAREVPAETRLRAELSPLRGGLLLRLVVTPLGPEGPRLSPGIGRMRIMAAIGGESIGTTRDLERERGHVDAVLDALPFLREAARAAPSLEWPVEDAELALAMVEALPKLDSLAGVDWPKGRSVRVVTVDSPQVALAVTTQRDWFRVNGRIELDEGLIIGLEALLDAARGRSRFVPLGDGAYAALTLTLKERLADLAAVVEADRKGLRAPRIAAAWLDQCIEGIVTEADRGFRQSIDRLREAQNSSFDVPRTLQAELRPYQTDGYNWAMRHATAGFGACLADDMGLGKTLQALAVLLARSQGGAALVVAPTSVCGNWLAEAQRFAPSLNMHLYAETDRADLIARAGAFDLVVVSYTLLQQAAEAFRSRGWHTLIADEAQAIKNSSAKRSIALFELEAEFRMALSGTPVENRLSELWSIMSLLNPGLLGSAARFRQRFAIPIERDRNRDAQQLLRRVIAPFVLRRTKAQVLHELPPRTEIVVPVAPRAEEAAHYEALRRSALAQVNAMAHTVGSSQARFSILAQLMKLRRAACDPRLASPELGFVGAKVQAFEELVTELSANGHKALVFSQFVDFLSLLREPLDRAGISYQYLDGATPLGVRTRRIAAFQSGESDLFLISLKAGGFGLNLTAADYVVIADPWWNPAAEDQATGRAHRIGQSRPVTVYRLVTQGTIEERIIELHQDKRALAESILAEGEAALLPTTEELIALMELEPASGRGAP